MSNKTKILLALLIAALILVFYLVIQSKPLSRIPEQSNEQTQKIAKVDLEQLENDYKKEAKAILQEYSELIKKDDLKAEELRAARDKLLALKVPAKFKDLHLNLVLALAKEENSLVEGNKEEENSGQEAIDEIKANYTWLN